MNKEELYQQFKSLSTTPAFKYTVWNNMFIVFLQHGYHSCYHSFWEKKYWRHQITKTKLLKTLDNEDQAIFCVLWSNNNCVTGNCIALRNILRKIVLHWETFCKINDTCKRVIGVLVNFTYQQVFWWGYLKISSSKSKICQFTRISMTLLNVSFMLLKWVFRILVNWRISTGILTRIPRAIFVRIPVEMRQFTSGSKWLA